MRNQTWNVLAVVALPLLLLACSKEDQAGLAAKTELLKPSEELGYSIGMEIGSSLVNLKEDIDIDSLLQGLRDQFNGNGTLLTEGSALEIRQEFSQGRQKAAKAELMKLAGKNKKEGDAFLADNGKKEGVITTASGLQYIVEKEGDGQTPTASDTTVLHYRGTLIDGTEFDSSYSRGKPAIFPVSGGMIPGWTEALQLMKVGSKYRVFIPSELAYGKGSPGPGIGPNTTLIFDIELLSIEKKS